MDAKHCCLERCFQQISEDGAVGGNQRKRSRKEDSEQKGLHIQPGGKETAEHGQGRMRSWVLLKQEERQERDEKIRAAIPTQAPDTVRCSRPSSPHGLLQDLLPSSRPIVTPSVPLSLP